MAATDPVTPEPRRFSIRLPRPLWIGVATVVIVVVAFGLQIGVPIYQQHLAIREITEIGGGISYADPTPRTRWLHRIVGRVPTDGVSGLTQEDAIECLKRIAPMEEVWFCPDEDTFYRRGPGRFCGPLPWTVGNTVSDTKLACVARLPHLKRLYLSNTNVSDAGMRHLCQVHTLEELYLDGTDLTDASLGELRRLGRLRTLSAVRTGVTRKGVADLRAVLPRCTVTYGSHNGSEVVEPPESKVGT